MVDQVKYEVRVRSVTASRYCVVTPLTYGESNHLAFA
jgi:hypothetical protein